MYPFSTPSPPPSLSLSRALPLPLDIGINSIFENYFGALRCSPLADAQVYNFEECRIWNKQSWASAWISRQNIQDKHLSLADLTSSTVFCSWVLSCNACNAASPASPAFAARVARSTSAATWAASLADAPAHQAMRLKMPGIHTSM